MILGRFPGKGKGPGTAFKRERFFPSCGEDEIMRVMRKKDFPFQGDASLPRVGISSCLAGERVRYDGGHKREDFLLERLEGNCTLLPVCPEFELGLGVPREPIGLSGDPGNPRLLGLESGADLTERMLTFCRRRAEEMAREGIGGFILKSRSPSCGLRGLDLLQRGGAVLKTGTGFWARALAERLPGLPMEEAESLRDPSRLEAFLERVRAYRPRRGGSGPFVPPGRKG